MQKCSITSFTSTCCTGRPQVDQARHRVEVLFLQSLFWWPECSLAEICPGQPFRKWVQRSLEDAGTVTIYGAGHRRCISGTVMWCRRCGAFAENRLVGLVKLCPGRLSNSSTEWRLGQLEVEKHPVSGVWLEGLVEHLGQTGGDTVPGIAQQAGARQSNGLLSNSRLQNVLQRVRARGASVSICAMVCFSIRVTSCRQLYPRVYNVLLTCEVKKR